MLLQRATILRVLWQGNTCLHSNRHYTLRRILGIQAQHHGVYWSCWFQRRVSFSAKNDDHDEMIFYDFSFSSLWMNFHGGIPPSNRASLSCHRDSFPDDADVASDQPVSY